MTKPYSKNVHLSFPTDISGQPLVCNLTRLFDLDFNILKAQITPRRKGYLTLELVGSEENCNNAIAYLREHEVEVTPTAQRIHRDEDSCMHCGLCTAICTTDALYVDPESRKVVFERERCTACGFCTRVCPVACMDMVVESC